MIKYTDAFLSWCGHNFIQYEKIIKDIIKDLGLTKEKIIFDCCWQKNAYAIKNDDSWRINFSEQDKCTGNYDFTFIVAHELRHVHQFVNGIYSYTTVSTPKGYCRYWNNKIYLINYYLSGIDYYHQPWEVDANQYAMSKIKNVRCDMNTDTFFGKAVYEITSFYNEIKEFIKFKTLTSDDDLFNGVVNEFLIRNVQINLKE